MKNKALLWVFAFLPTLLLSQGKSADFYANFDDSPRGSKAARVMFYNVENLFNYTHDSLKRDQEYLPEGTRHWNKNKYWTKQKQIAKVITAVGGWEMPALVGLAEVENLHTLLNLAYNTQLKSTNYQIIHHESPDRRGIDVALLYRKEKFQLIHDCAIRICFPFDTTSYTRDILYVKGVLCGTDTIHLVVSHWPSKWGGAFVTQPKRKYVAEQIRKLTDSIILDNSRANILIMGDLNDTPIDESLTQGLGSVLADSSSKEPLYNLMLPMKNPDVGTHFYKGPTGAEWNLIDQFIVSKSLYYGNAQLKLKGEKAYIFKAPFLLEKNNEGIEIPNRTYLGMKYHGGYSDHLPIYLDIIVRDR